MTKLAALAAEFALVVVFGISSSPIRADDWPQWRGQNRNSVWKETDVLERFPAKGLTRRWGVSVAASFSSPVVADGRVYFIDAEHQPKVQERVRCIDARSGQILWTHAYPAKYPDWALKPENPNGPVASSLVRDGKVYTLGRTGNLFCLATRNGSILWHKDLDAEYHIKEFSATSSPLIESDLLVLQLSGKPDAGVVAFNKESGKQVWKSLDEEQYHSSPIVIDAGGTRQLIVWTQAAVTSLDPKTGKPFWRERFLGGAPVSTPVFDKPSNLLLVAGLMLKLESEKPAARVLWPKSSAAGRRILSGTSTGLILGNHVYSARSSGTFVCLDAMTGEQLWETDKITESKGGASIHPVVNGHSVLLFTDEGNLIRARLTPEGYQEISRTRLVEPTYPWSGKKLIWPPPAYANRHVFVHNDLELICASLEEKP